MGFCRQEHWSGLPCPPPGDLPYQGTEPMSLTSPAWAGGLFTTRATWEGPSRGRWHICATNLSHLCTWLAVTGPVFQCWLLCIQARCGLCTGLRLLRKLSYFLTTIWCKSYSHRWANRLVWQGNVLTLASLIPSKVLLYSLKHSWFTKSCSFQGYNTEIWLYTCIYILFRVFSFVGYYKLLSIAPCVCSRCLLVTLTPSPQLSLPHHFALVTISSFSIKLRLKFGSLINAAALFPRSLHRRD